MDHSLCSEILDCKVQVQTYVLVAQPSRWRRKGQRTIIHAPLCDISTTPYIPAKRFHHGEEQNAVCFIKPSDIERDTSVIYEELSIGPSPSWVDAHGVALRESPSSNSFNYQRGDRLWIYIGPNTDGFDTSVPVINLRTRESGTIVVEHVCWYPRLRDTDDNLYTLGGDVRSLKQHGSRKFSYWSWAICQRLDISQCGSKSIQVPTQESKVDGCWLLALEEAQLLFEKKSRFIEKRLQPAIENGSLWLNSPPTSPAPRELSAPPMKRTRYDQERRASSAPTPPSTPPTPREHVRDADRRVIQCGHGRRTFAASLTLPRTLELTDKPSSPKPKRSSPRRGGIEMWRRILESVPAQPNESIAQSTSDAIMYEDSSTTLSSSKDSDSDDDPYPFSYEESLCSPSEQQQEANEFEAASILCGLGREEQLVAGVHTRSLNGQQEFHIDPVVPERYAKSCDLSKASCVYIFHFTCKHFHAPPPKCIIKASASDPSIPKHEHCISRIRPYPGQAGPCMLFEKPSKKHNCCRWEEEDMVDWAQLIMEDSEREKIESDKRVRFQVYDLSRWIHRKDQFLPGIPPIFRLQGYNALEAALANGTYDAEIQNLRSFPAEQGFKGND